MLFMNEFVFGYKELDLSTLTTGTDFYLGNAVGVQNSLANCVPINLKGRNLSYPTKNKVQISRLSQVKTTRETYVVTLATTSSNAGKITIKLSGVEFAPILFDTSKTVSEIGALIASKKFDGWTVSHASGVVTFTAKKYVTMVNDYSATIAPQVTGEAVGTTASGSRTAGKGGTRFTFEIWSANKDDFSDAVKHISIHTCASELNAADDPVVETCMPSCCGKYVFIKYPSVTLTLEGKVLIRMMEV